MLDKVNILGLNFSHITQKDTINLLHQNIKDEKKTFIVTANPEIVMYASQNSDYWIHSNPLIILLQMESALYWEQKY